MKNITHISKFLSLVLRHKPEEIGIVMEASGWVNVDELIEKSIAKGIALDFDTLEEAVVTNDKQRFAFNDDHTKIRANQRHSVTVDLDLNALEPLEYLYHGTVERFMDAIRSQGLQKMQRRHVHLSKDLDTAMKVASRRGRPVILKIAALQMHRDGHAFYRSENGVWLCDHVPAHYIDLAS